MVVCVEAGSVAALGCSEPLQGVSGCRPGPSAPALSEAAKGLNPFPPTPCPSRLRVFQWHPRHRPSSVCAVVPVRARRVKMGLVSLS